MKMAWWVFMSLLTVQIILLQYMVEEFLAGHYDGLFYYILALGFMFIVTVVTYVFFRKIDKVTDH
jgi:membrane protein CcdC involved in cytochrome C biogenesis